MQATQDTGRVGGVVCLADCCLAGRWSRPGLACKRERSGAEIGRANGLRIRKALPARVKPAIILGFPECVQGDLTRRADICGPFRSAANAAMQPVHAAPGFKSSSPELNLKE